MRYRVRINRLLLACLPVLHAASADAGSMPATFASQTYPLLGNSHVAVDVNSDGRPDLLGVGAALRVMLNTGGGMLAPFVPYTVAGASQDVAAGDFNSDGRIDVAVSINSATTMLSLLSGNGDGTFNAPVNIPNTTAADSPCVVATDLNNDGRLDLLVTHEIACFAAPCVASQKLSILLGNGNGTFGPPNDITVGTGMRKLAVGDFNHDLRKDLAICGDTTRLYILLGNGNGTFAAPTTITLVPGGDLFSASNDVEIADFNEDGKQDIAVALPGNGRGTAILLGNGNGTFQTPVRILDNALDAPQSLAVADFNRDGALDIARALGDGTGGLFDILYGQGNGTFQSAIKHLAPPPQSSLGGIVLVPSDLSHDRKPDLALLVGGASPSLRVVLNTTPVAPCPADIVHSGVSDLRVDIDDLVAVITQWGRCPAPPALCPANIAQTGASAGVVNIDDLVMVITSWGDCP